MFSCVHLSSIFCANVLLWKRWNLTNQTELNLAEIMWRWQKSYIVSTSQWKTRGCLTPQNKIMNELSLFSADHREPLLTRGPEWIMCLIKGAAVLEVDTMISPCKNHKNDPRLAHLPSFRHLNSVWIQQRASRWVGPELGVTTYCICWKMNIHKRGKRNSESRSREEDYTVIAHLCSPVSGALWFLPHCSWRYFGYKTWYESYSVFLSGIHDSQLKVAFIQRWQTDDFQRMTFKILQ